jgi:segregation and condensation protein A
MHPVDLLVDLVISDELDPWDIDIVDIANRFLEEVRQMAKINLRLSGKTLLAASILLRMKSENIMPEEEEEEEEIIWPDAFYAEVEEIKEEILPISAPVRRRAERKTTLFELIEALQRALSEEMIRKNFPRNGKQRTKLVIQVDEEDIKEKIAKVYAKIKKLADIAEVVKFSELISNREEIVEVFLALLYLDSQMKITIWQKELFGEIFITLN